MDREKPEAYRPPQKLLVPCAVCGSTVLRGIAMEGGKVKSLRHPVSPILGEPHVCIICLTPDAPTD